MVIIRLQLARVKMWRTLGFSLPVICSKYFVSLALLPSEYIPPSASSVTGSFTFPSSTNRQELSPVEIKGGQFSCKRPTNSQEGSVTVEESRLFCKSHKQIKVCFPVLSARRNQNCHACSCKCTTQGGVQRRTRGWNRVNAMQSHGRQMWSRSASCPLPWVASTKTSPWDSGAREIGLCCS